jgi:flagellin
LATGQHREAIARGDLGGATDLAAFETFLADIGAAITAGVDTGATLRSGAPLWFHVGANIAQGVHLNIEAVNVNALHAVAAGHDRTVIGFNIGDLRNTDLAHGVGVMQDEGYDINQFLTGLDAALAHVAGQRAHLGAMQNRLEFTIENLDIASENLNAANSRIRDADMAQEMMRFTQSNVLQQAAISMLAQANQAPQSILSLLR